MSKREIDQLLSEGNVYFKAEAQGGLVIVQHNEDVNVFVMHTFDGDDRIGFFLFKTLSECMNGVTQWVKDQNHIDD